MEEGFTWSVSNESRGMLKMSWKNGESFGSSCFRRGNDLWHLLFCPLGDSDNKRDVVIRLCRLHTGKKVTVEGGITLSTPGARPWTFGISHTLSEDETYIRVPLYRSLNDMYRYYPPHRDLRVTCSINVIGVFDSSGDGAASDLSRSMESLYHGAQSSDVLLCAKKRQLRAHRNVLAGRSPKFAELLGSAKTTRKKETVLRLDHIDEDVLEELVFHAYTGKTKKPLVYETAKDVLAAAREFGFEDLARQCVDHLASQLSVETVIDLVVFAEVEGDRELGEKVMRYFRNHFRKIQQTDRWKSFVSEQPTLGVRVLSIVMEHNI